MRFQNWILCLHWSIITDTFFILFFKDTDTVNYRASFVSHRDKKDKMLFPVEILSTYLLSVIIKIQQTHYESNTISLSKQDVGHVTELRINRYTDMGGDRKHLPLRELANPWKWNKWQIQVDEWHRKCVVSGGYRCCLTKICFGFGLFQLFTQSR